MTPPKKFKKNGLHSKMKQKSADEFVARYDANNANASSDEEMALANGSNSQ